MILKKLEIYGFKSFAERLELVFHQGVTGVVGPNGSGKSNIADAVRWALGEQSAKTLRGGKMEDVIFGGTQTRKALSYCEVSLTFENAAGTLPVDFHEVVVTRRVYRSGESEYSINRTACRLRDVTELFRDTGIGKEGYSLIGQGRIDEILSARSEERRAVFEEAAGIAKYKARRQEAESKLNKTGQNLSRVEDILTELSAQQESLSEQAETARRYLSIAQELKTLEINDFLIRHDRGRARITELMQILEQMRAQDLDLQNKEQSAQTAIERTQDALAEGDRSAARANEQLLEQTRDTQMREGALNLLRQQAAQQEEEIARLKREEKESEERLHELSRMGEGEIPSALPAMRQKLDALEKEYGASSDELAAVEEALEKAKASMIEGMNRLSGVQSAKARLHATMEGYLHRLDRLSEQDAAFQKQSSLVQQDVEQAEAALAQAREEAAAHRQQIELLQRQIASLQKSLDEAVLLRTQTQGALREAQSRLKLLTQMERDYEGYQHSVRRLMQHCKSRGEDGVYGTVAEILRVPKEYERALEMTLGSQLQHVVCRDQRQAKLLIDWLRAEGAGRATFLPLDAVRPRLLTQAERDCLSMPGCIGLASELIDFDERYRPIAENLLGRTVIAKDLEAGIPIMQRGRHAFRLVTLQGDVMHSGGSMTGGSVRARSTSLLSREREVEEHKQAVLRLQRREEEAAASEKEYRDALAKARSQEAERSESAHRMEIETERASAKLRSAKSALDAAVQAGETGREEERQLRDAVAELQSQLAELERASFAEEKTAVTEKQDIEALQLDAAARRQAVEQKRAALQALQVEHAAQAREEEALLRDVKRREQEAEAARQRLLQGRERIQALILSVEKSKQDIADGQSALERSNGHLAQQQTAARQAEIEKVKVQQALRDRLEEQKSIAKSRAELAESLHRSEMQLSRAQSELDNSIERIWEAYEVTYGNAEEYRLAETPPGSAQRIEALRREIRQMGSVNVSSIEEYRGIKERCDTLSAQREDLLKAQADIERLIRRLTGQMQEIFSGQFALLNRHFSHTFQALFGGGRAELRLSDKNDVLGSEIEIVAQPPGKRLQLLSLLSGGERALTAIAVLFAMLELKPTPFCILDEIEAALDDANIDHFARFLADYAKKTQFIVITHRRGTMESCDVLYGVAMRERGVSSMVSVEMAALDAIEA